MLEKIIHIFILIQLFFNEITFMTLNYFRFNVIGSIEAYKSKSIIRYCDQKSSPGRRTNERK